MRRVSIAACVTAATRARARARAHVRDSRGPDRRGFHETARKTGLIGRRARAITVVACPVTMHLHAFVVPFPLPLALISWLILAETTELDAA